MASAQRATVNMPHGRFRRRVEQLPLCTGCPLKACRVGVNEILGRWCHHHLHLGAEFFQQARQFSGFISGDTTADAQQNVRRKGSSMCAQR